QFCRWHCQLAFVVRSARGVWMWGRCQICSQRLLASWQRRVAMLVAPGTVQRMPESLSRWPMTALQPASTGSSYCTSKCGLFSSFGVAGSDTPGSELGLGLGGEGDADCAGARFAVIQQAGFQPVVDGAWFDAEAGGDL